MVQAVHYFSNYSVESWAQTPTCDDASMNFIGIKIDLRNIQDVCKWRGTCCSNTQQHDSHKKHLLTGSGATEMYPSGTILVNHNLKKMGR